MHYLQVSDFCLGVKYHQIYVTQLNALSNESCLRNGKETDLSLM